MCASGVRQTGRCSFVIATLRETAHEKTGSDSTATSEIRVFGHFVRKTEWDEFRGLDLAKLAGRMRDRVLVDLRNVYDPEEAERAGFDYRGVGRSARRTAPVASD